MLIPHPPPRGCQHVRSQAKDILSAAGVRDEDLLRRVIVGGEGGPAVDLNKSIRELCRLAAEHGAAMADDTPAGLFGCVPVLRLTITRSA